MRRHARALLLSCSLLSACSDVCVGGWVRAAGHPHCGLIVLHAAVKGVAGLGCGWHVASVQVWQSLCSGTVTNKGQQQPAGKEKKNRRKLHTLAALQTLPYIHLLLLSAAQCICAHLQRSQICAAQFVHLPAAPAWSRRRSRGWFASRSLPAGTPSMTQRPSSHTAPSKVAQTPAAAV